jgi:hypothetical protein
VELKGWDTHYAVDGCGSDTDKQCKVASATAAVRCCGQSSNTCHDSYCTQEQMAATGWSFLAPQTNIDGTAATFAEAEGECTARGQRLCSADELEAQVCCGTGCGFDHQLVWTSSACVPDEVMEAQSTEHGVGMQVIDGKTGADLACVADPSVTTTNTPSSLGGSIIAAQCCTYEDECVRYLGTNDDQGCIAGFSNNAGTGGLRPMTYSEASLSCAIRGLQLCDKPCNGKGCYYDHAPVWTRLPCTVG